MNYDKTDFFRSRAKESGTGLSLYLLFYFPLKIKQPEKAESGK